MEKGVKRVECWANSEGKLFHTQIEACQSQVKIDLYDFLQEKGVGSGGEWSLSMIVDALMEDGQKIYDIFNA